MDRKLLQFDYQSSTPCSSDVISEMQPYWSDYWGNPSSKQNLDSSYGSTILKISKDKILHQISDNQYKVIFTSGATEANNLALLGYARYMSIKNGKKGHIITLNTEHVAVLDPIRQLSKEGFSVTELSVMEDGLLSINDFKESIRDDTFLVSIMSGNNEIGVLQPIKEIYHICKNKGIIFHSDATQSLGLQREFPTNLGIDMVTISSHKIYGPKGIGALILKKNLVLQPLSFGGSQEYGLRPGTCPLPLVVGFTKAVENSVVNLNQNCQYLKLLRDSLKKGLEQNISNLIINGSCKNRLPNNLNISIPDINGTEMHRRLRPYISCSSGSACSEGKPSHVLIGLGRSKREAKSSIRLSLGLSTGLDDVNAAISIISQVVRDLK